MVATSNLPFFSQNFSPASGVSGTVHHRIVKTDGRGSYSDFVAIVLMVSCKLCPRMMEMRVIQSVILSVILLK